MNIGLSVIFSLNPNTEVVLIYQLHHSQIRPPSFKTKPEATFTSTVSAGGGYANNKSLELAKKLMGKGRPETEDSVPKRNAPGM